MSIHLAKPSLKKGRLRCCYYTYLYAIGCTYLYAVGYTYGYSFMFNPFGVAFCPAGCTYLYAVGYTYGYSCSTPLGLPSVP